VQHRFDGDGLARSYRDLARRGHVRGTGIDAVVEAYEAWDAKDQLPGAKEIGRMVERLPAYAAQAKSAVEEPVDTLPDYEQLVEKHNPRRR
jgi:hypothetical protein